MSAAPAIHTDTELRTLGRHRIIAKLGQGGMANVFLTVVQGQHGVNKLFVAKVLLADLALDPDFRSMFVKEARVATLLHHRNLVQSFEVAETEGNHYITMEYLEGRPLHAVIAVVGREAMPLDVHVGILALALTGLHAAHEQTDLTGQSLDLVHRDVSPQNIFVTYDGEVKVVDFGVAKVKGGTVTEAGSFFGKIGYVAPEQALSGPIDRRADVFAVGVMLWEAIARRSFVDRSEGEAAALRKRLNGEIPSPKTVAPDAPPELIAICERAIAYEPADRYATAAEFEEALNEYLQKKTVRVGAKEISRVVAPAFAEERTRMRALIERQIANTDAVPADVGVLGEASGSGASRSRPIAPSSASPGGSKRNAFIAAGVVAGIGVVLAMRALAPTNAPAPSVTSAAPPPVAVSPPPEPTAPARATVRARIHVTPATAQLALDGKPLGDNPFVGELPRDGAAHLLTASASGYASLSHEVRLDNDVDVDLTLVPLPARPAPVLYQPGRRSPRYVPAPQRPTTRPVDDKDPYAK
jgi:serine/threonine protein kinase